MPPELRLSASPAKQIHQFQQADINPPQTGKIKQQEWASIILTCSKMALNASEWQCQHIYECFFAKIGKLKIRKCFNFLRNFTIFLLHNLFRERVESTKQ